METAKIANALFDWYQINQRDLPWRMTKDPYRIWISEIVLQQTRIEQGTPYYLRFLERFPTVQGLATASIEEVLLIWQGLGYYSRARNMHAAANQVMDDFMGVFPSSYSELIQLKGVGKYTAAAISSITASEKRAVVDGNVIRLISRLWAIEEPVDLSSTLAKIEAIAALLIVNHESGTLNQAMMEYGAMVCVPKNPECNVCGLNLFCCAHKLQKQAQIPNKKPKSPTLKRYFNYLYIADSAQRFLIYQRSSSDIWHGLFELPLLENQFLEASEIIQFLEFQPSAMNDYAVQKHQLSHQQIHTRVWVIGCDSVQLEDLALRKNCLITDGNSLNNYPVSKLMNHVFLLIQDLHIR